VNHRMLPSAVSGISRRGHPHRLTRDDLEAFCRIDDQHALSSILFDYTLILAVAAVAMWMHRTPVTLLALLIIAGRQSALQGLVHSACHYSLFSRRQRNNRLEFLYALPILDTVPLYRAQHLEHHRDFKLKTADRLDYLHDTLDLSRTGIWARTWVVFIRPLLGHAGWVFLSDVIRALHDDPRSARKLIIYWMALLSAAALCGVLWPLFLYWIVPLLWLYPVLDIWAELSDHLDIRGDSRNQEGFFYSLLLKDHETYHAVHHLYPRVPYYRLRALHDRLRELGLTMENSRGALDFLRIVYRSAQPRTPLAAVAVRDDT
jgi:fatty acid desaturase